MPHRCEHRCEHTFCRSDDWFTKDLKSDYSSHFCNHLYSFLSTCFIFVLLTQRTAEIKHRIPRREWSIIFKRQIIHYFNTFLHFYWPQIIQTSMMNGHLPSPCVTSNIPSSPRERELWHRCPFTQDWIALPLCTRTQTYQYTLLISRYN